MKPKKNSKKTYCKGRFSEQRDYENRKTAVKDILLIFLSAFYYVLFD